MKTISQRCHDHGHYQKSTQPYMITQSSVNVSCRLLITKLWNLDLQVTTISLNYVSCSYNLIISRIGH